MRTSGHWALCAALLGCIPTAALAGPGGPWQFNENFAGNQTPAGLKLFGSAAIDNESLLLTSDAPGQAGLSVIGGGKIARFSASFDYSFQHAGPGFTADGMSFNLGLVPDGVVEGPSWEKGPGSGLSVSFDIYDFPENGSLATYGIRVLRDGAVVASALNAMTQADRGLSRPVLISLQLDGTISVFYNGTQPISNVQTGYVPDPRHRFSLAARTGGQSAEQRVDNILVSPFVVLSSDLCRDAAPIHGDGCYWFDTNDATTDGIAACDSVGTPGNTGITKDVWFCWTAAATGVTTFSTVNNASWDTKMAIYADCGLCPEGLGLLACNDNAGSSLRAEIAQRVVAGRRYLVRLGGSPGSADGQSGPGYIAITTVPDCPADFNHSGGVPSVPDIFAFLTSWFAGCP